MSQQFPIDVEKFLQQEVAVGRYPDREAVIVEAVRLLQRESAEPTADIQVALDDFAAGRFQDLDETFRIVRRAGGLSDQ